jgi:RimJ/RimL family protein N-acetyltransferase
MIPPVPPANQHDQMIRGELVYLRPAERDDILMFVRWMTDATTTRHLDRRSPIGRAMEERWFEEVLEGHGRNLWFFVICRIVDGRQVGSLDLREIDAINGSAALGIAIGDPADTGHGYGTDALTSIIDFGFGELRLHRIWLDVHESNVRAETLYRRIGFVSEATLRRALFRRGQFEDVHRMGLLRSEWAARRPVATPATSG